MNEKKRSRIYSYSPMFKQQTWTVNLRRVAGKPSIVSVTNLKGEKLRHVARIMGDKLIIVLKEGPSHGRAIVRYKGAKYKYLHRPDWWAQIKFFFKKLFRR